MEVFAINVCTKTISKDRYGEVAVNPYPIMIYGTKADLYRYLQSKMLVDYIKQLLPTKELYKRSTYKIRHCTTEEAKETFDIDVSEITPVKYTSRIS